MQRPTRRPSMPRRSRAPWSTWRRRPRSRDARAMSASAHGDAPAGETARAALATAVGIQAEYHDVSGNRHGIGSETRERLLAALGFAAPDELTAESTLQALRDETARRPLGPTSVVAQASEHAPIAVVGRAAPDASVEYALWLRREGDASETLLAEGRAAADATGALRLTPAGLAPPYGYHALRLDVEDGRGHRSATQQLIVVPPRCTAPRDVLRGERAVGTDREPVHRAQRPELGHRRRHRPARPADVRAAGGCGVRRGESTARAAQRGRRRQSVQPAQSPLPQRRCIWTSRRSRSWPRRRTCSASSRARRSRHGSARCATRRSWTTRP